MPKGYEHLGYPTYLDAPGRVDRQVCDHRLFVPPSTLNDIPSTYHHSFIKSVMAVIKDRGGRGGLPRGARRRGAAERLGQA